MLEAHARTMTDAGDDGYPFFLVVPNILHMSMNGGKGRERGDGGIGR